MRGYPLLRGLSSFVGRAAVFFFVVAAILLFLYAAGSAQGFLESTQVLLLLLLRAALWIDVACAAWYAVSLVVRVAAERRPFVARWLLLLLGLAADGALLVALQFLRQWLAA